MSPQLLIAAVFLLVGIVFLVLSIPELKWLWKNRSVQHKFNSTTLASGNADFFGSVEAVIHESGSPEQLKRSAEDFLRMNVVAAFPHKAAQIVSQQAYLSVNVPYSDLDNKLGRFRTGFDQALTKFVLGTKKDYAIRKDFDAVLEPGIALNQRVLYNFPFFLTSRRRDLWGVIPYGHHRAVGFLLHKENPAFAKWNALQGERNQETKEAKIRDWIL